MRGETTYRVGVDIGGTFTDIVLIGSNGAVLTKKIASSVEDYARAIVEGLAEVFSEAGIAGSAIEEIRHGTTVASNAILEQKGARVGLITTKGFRDVLEIRTPSGRWRHCSPRRSRPSPFASSTRSSIRATS